MEIIENEKEMRARVKYWLEVHGMSRRELAERLSVTEGAINGWLSNRPIPPARWEEIKALFESDKEPERNNVVGTTLSKEELEKVGEAAQVLNLELTDFLREMILRQVDELLKK